MENPADVVADARLQDLMIAHPLKFLNIEAVVNGTTEVFPSIDVT